MYEPIEIQQFVDELKEVCKKEIINPKNDNMHLIYFYTSAISNRETLCKGYSEWIWSEDFSLLKEVMLVGVLYYEFGKMVQWDEYVSFENTVCDLMQDIENNNPEVIKNKEAFKDLKDIIYKNFIQEASLTSTQIKLAFEQMNSLFDELQMGLQMKYFDNITEAQRFSIETCYNGEDKKYDNYNSYFDSVTYVGTTEVLKELFNLFSKARNEDKFNLQ